MCQVVGLLTHHLAVKPIMALVHIHMVNGGDWASKAGYSVSHEPKLHTALSFVQGQAGSDPTYGHVAFVEQVKDDGSILISEMNVTGLPPLTVSYRTFSADEAKQFWYVEGK